MEKQSKYLIIILLVFAVCMGVFWHQYNNDVSTFIMINETEVAQNGSFSGMLVDAYGQGVANKTITYHKPGYQMGTLVDVTTKDDGSFTIDNAQYQVVKTIMVILHLLEMVNTRNADMKVMLLSLPSEIMSCRLKHFILNVQEYQDFLKS